MFPLQFPYRASPCAIRFQQSSIFLIVRHTQHDYRGKKKLLHVNYVFLFYLKLLSSIVVIVWRIQWDVIAKVQRPSYTVDVILVRFKQICIFFKKYFRQKLKQKFTWKSFQRKPSFCMQQTGVKTDRQTEMTKLTDALRSSANPPKNETKLYRKSLKETYYFGKRSKDGIIILKQGLNK